MLLRLHVLGQFPLQGGSTGRKLRRLFLGGRAPTGLGLQRFAQRLHLPGHARVLGLQLRYRRLRGCQFLRPRRQAGLIGLLAPGLRLESLLLLRQFRPQLLLRLCPLGQFPLQFGTPGRKLRRLFLGGRPPTGLGLAAIRLSVCTCLGHAGVLGFNFRHRRLRGFQFLGPRRQTGLIGLLALGLRLKPLLLLRQFRPQLLLRLRPLGQLPLQFGAPGRKLRRLLSRRPPADRTRS